MATMVSPSLNSGDELLHGGEDCSGASANKQMIIANEGQTCFDGALLVYRYDPVRIGTVCQLRPQACSDTGYVSLSGAASECDRADRLDGHDLDFWKFLAKALRNPGECARRSCTNEDPVDLFELARNLFCRLLGMNLLVGQVVVLIEPDGVGLRLEYPAYDLKSVGEESAIGVAIVDDDHLRPICSMPRILARVEFESVTQMNL